MPGLVLHEILIIQPGFKSFISVYRLSVYLLDQFHFQKTCDLDKSKTNAFFCAHCFMQYIWVSGKVMEESDIRGMGERTVRVGKNDGIERLFVARQNG